MREAPSHAGDPAVASFPPGRLSPRLAPVDVAWLGIILAALLAIYIPGLGNDLVYDDSYLTEGLFSEYASLLEPHVRMLSYGSFVWVHALAGDGWWKQRLFNLLIHGGVVLSLWALYREILRHIELPAGEPAAAGATYDRSPALGLAIAFFALNPVAVYAVAYLIQRSILLATLFVVLGLWRFARAAAGRHRAANLVAALACYALAVASKEHAVLAPLAALPIYVVVARPSRKRLAVFTAIMAALGAIAGFLLWRRYGNILGQAFDEYSVAYLAQLGRLAPDAEKHAYSLSILNQSWLFFQYGLRWFLPVSEWLSINLRPPFPLSWMSFPHVLGLLGYAAVVAGGFVLVLRHRDWRALIGLSLLLPALLFGTEFATVWVQDPFVLYRSYLWAIGVPGLVFFVLHGPAPKVLLAVGSVAAALLVWQSLDRVVSLATPESIWTDAIAKLSKDPRSVGRWFPYLNRGAYYVDHNQYEAALRDFQASAMLGDMGMGDFNSGAMLANAGRHAQALAAFDRAARQGYSLYNLPVQRGLALEAVGRMAEANAELRVALVRNLPPSTREVVLLHLGRTALQLGRPQEAISDFSAVLRSTPSHREARYLLAMACISNGEHARALLVVDALLAEGERGPLRYARALANHGLKRKADALADIDAAIRLGPANPLLQQWRDKIRAMP